MFTGLSLSTSNEVDGSDDFFAGVAANGTSNLADIFGVSLTPSIAESDATLKYIPPKPNQQQKSTEKSNWNVELAKVVTAFKLIKDENVSQGKLGLALLNSSESTSKLILYRTKEIILSTLLLKAAVTIYWKPPYLQYRDDLNVFWSLSFANSKDVDEFLSPLEDKCSIDRSATSQSEEGNSTEQGETENVISELTDTDDDNATNKSKIVTRMAKVGHQLPKLIGIPQSETDSSMSPDIVKEKPSLSQHPIKLPLRSGTAENPLVLAAGPALSSQPIGPNISVAVQPSTFWRSNNVDLANLAMTENRVQNTEVRMNLSKLDSKLDRVLDRIEYLKLSAGRSAADDTDKDEEIIKLEEKMLELKKENRCLKLQIKKMGDEPNTKIADNNSQKEAQVDSNGEEKALLAALQKSNNEKEVLQKGEDKNVAKITELTARLKELEENLKEEKGKVAKLEENKKSNEALLSQVKNLQSLLESKESAIRSLEQSAKETNSKNNDTVRAIMNELYVKLFQSVNDRDIMTSTEVLKLTAEIIRKETKAALNQ